MQLGVKFLSAGIVLTVSFNTPGQDLIIESGGDVAVVIPPADISWNTWESDAEIRVWYESRGLLAQSEDIGHTGPGLIDDDPQRVPGSVPSGTRYESYLVRMDAVGDGGPGVQLSGFIRFDSPIIGVYIGSGIGSRDPIFQRPGVLYNTNDFRGLELPGQATEADSFEISSDRRRIDFTTDVDDFTDDIRVLVRVPGAAGQYDRNLVRNSDFEAVVQDPDGVVSLELPGKVSVPVQLVDWQVVPSVPGETSLSLNRYLGEFPPRTGVIAGGGDTFVVGTFTEMSSLSQQIDIAFATELIDDGRARYRLDAILGSFFGAPEQDDITTVRLRFFDGSPQPAVLRTDVLVGPSEPSDVGLPLTGFGSFLSPLVRTGVIPAGTRSVGLTIELVRDDGSFADAFNNAGIELVQFSINAPCPADTNNNGVADPGDFTSWIAAYNMGDLVADSNQNGVLDPGDFTAWVAAYNIGC